MRPYCAIMSRSPADRWTGSFCRPYVPKLQSVGWVYQFLRWQRGYEIPSSAAFGKIGDAYVAEMHRWARVNGVPVRRFAKGEKEQGGHHPPAACGC